MVECPQHKKILFLPIPVEAIAKEDAIEKTIGRSAVCPHPPRHSFTVEKEHVVGAQPISLSTTAPSRIRPPAYVPPPPPEKVYYINPDAAAKLRKKSAWWSK
jgi:hypothetical protein